MREIKFRVWDDIEKQILDVKELEFDDEGNIYGADVWKPDGSETYGVEFKWNEAVLLQYTGLKDKEGKEIYEGDIVLFAIDQEDSLYEIVFNEEYAGFEAKCIKSKDKGLIGKTCNIFAGRIREVIGNIFENSELLEKIK